MDKLDGLNLPNFQTEEIDLLLNTAQDRFVKQRYGVNNNKRQSFEETQKRTEDLKGLIVQTGLTPLRTSFENIAYNSVFIQTPIDHWFTINERAIIQCATCNDTLTVATQAPGDTPNDTTIQGKYVLVRPIQHNEFDKLINDPFQGPNNNEILRLMYQNYIELIVPNNTTLYNYFIRYLKYPVRVDYNGDVTFELSDHTHSEIIDEAVNIAIEGIESKRVQTYPIIKNTNE